MKIFNTATRQVEDFVTYTPGLARGYVCGITPYDHVHVGHGRVYVFFDMFRRYLEARGYEVRLVINFTDIDDKIINKAREEFGHETYKRWKEVPERYIAEFFELNKKLFIKPAYAYPRVTENVEYFFSYRFPIGGEGIRPTPLPDGFGLLGGVERCWATTSCQGRR